MSTRIRIPLRLLAILLGIERSQPALLAAMQKEFGLADLAEDAERPVSSALANTLLAWLHRRSADRGFALNLGLESSISSGGPLGVHLAACPSLQAALGELQLWFPLLTWDGSRCVVQPHARGVLVEITGLETTTVADLLRQDLLLGRLLKLARRLAGDATRPLLLVYPESAFGVPPGLEAQSVQLVLAPGRLALLFGEADAGRPSGHRNPLLLNLLRPELEKELEQLQREDTLAARIWAWFAGMESLQDASQAGAAQHFHLSESSLKRHLAEEGSSFTELLQGYRRDRALELLTGTEDKLESIARVLGFSERASFERAFRSWFDTTPSNYRDQIRRIAGESASVEALDVDQLPSSPRVCARVLELLGRDDYHLDELVSAVNLDPSLTAKIMGIASSAFYGRRQVRSLDEAIGTVLGVDQVRYLALISAANAEFSRDLPPGFDLARYWLEALMRAELAAALLPLCAAEAIADGYETALAALLLDIGGFVLAHLQPAQTEAFLEHAPATPDGATRQALEIECFGTTRRAAGALLMAHWNLPREAIRIVRDLDSAEGDTPPADASLVRAIARYAGGIGAGEDPEAAAAVLLAALEGVGGMSASAAAQIVARQAGRTEDLRALVEQLIR